MSQILKKKDQEGIPKTSYYITAMNDSCSFLSKIWEHLQPRYDNAFLGSLSLGIR